MDFTLERAWLGYLRDFKVISNSQRMDLITLLENRRASVHTQAMEFSRRMKTDHPELWLSFKAKQRVLGYQQLQRSENDESQ
jgi:hypothetical protein